LYAELASDYILKVKGRKKGSGRLRDTEKQPVTRNRRDDRKKGDFDGRDEPGE